jgi:ABC-type glycerol-3-phosphate transport system permease component
MVGYTMKRRTRDLPLHLVLLTFAALTLTPFLFVLNNSFRRTSEQYRSFFGLPQALKQLDFPELFRGYGWAWQIFRPYMINSLLVSLTSALGVVLIGSVSAYVFSRYRFRGHRLLFLIILSFMMIPGVLTLVPSFLWVKRLGLINSYSVLILPYIAGGQIIAIFLMKGFFDGLPQELFESARLDGAGHFQQYWHIVLPLSKQILAVVVIVNLLGTWNNFLWPQVANSDSRYAVVSTGLYLMSHTQTNAYADKSTMYAAYVISAIPLLVLFCYATKPFMTGVTSGAFKA